MVDQLVVQLKRNSPVSAICFWTLPVFPHSLYPGQAAGHSELPPGRERSWFIRDLALGEPSSTPDTSTEEFWVVNSGLCWCVPQNGSS